MIRLGIVGTGGMANAHANAYRLIKGVSVVACADVDTARAAGFAARWKIPAAYGSHTEMLANEALNAVSVVTPDSQHSKIVIDAIGKGCHVLCEKPLADSCDAAGKMVKALKNRAMVGMVNFSCRDFSGFQGMAAAIQEGKIGEIRHVEAQYLQSWLVARSYGDWRKSPALLWRLSKKHGSHGALGDLGSHLFDLLRVCVGEISEVSCRLGTFPKGEPGEQVGEYKLDANDSAVASLVFARGAMGQLSTTRWAAGNTNALSIAIYGTEGATRFDLDRDPEAYSLIRGRMKLDKAEWTTVSCRPYPNTYERFIDSIVTGKSGYANFRDGMLSLELVEACLRSDRKKTWIRMPRVKD